MTKQEIKKLDKLVEKKSKEDADYRCEICGQGWERVQLNSHHVVGRRFRSTRWVLSNLVCLCVSHHTFGLWSAHENPGWFIKRIRDIRGEEWWKELQELSTKINKMDFETNKYLMDKSLKEVLSYYKT